MIQHHQHHHEHVVEEGEEEAKKKSNGSVGIGFVKVMTDDQLETLRKQISVYATICDQLVQMHKNLTSHPDLPGVRLYCDPMLTAGGHNKISARQRWTPTPVQLQILEGMFERGNGTPTKQKIKEITSELGQHGPISETNVYNWFQNRRARSKRKHQTSGPSVTGESEVETEVDSPKDKKTRPHELLSTAVPGDLCFQSPDMRFFDAHTGKGEPVFERDLPQMPFYDGLLSNQRSEQLIGKMEVNGGYEVYGQGEDYNMNG